ncbi:MAG: tetratricopeptide repeat protein, partial [Candidatus Lindowbacteria bacterium]|nr:tetratricopeptide repeat protein [Candidatus Lindowbacteria bacterium]
MMKTLVHTPGSKAAALSLLICGAALLLSVVLPLGALADENVEFRRARAAVSGGRLLEAQSMLEDLIERYPRGRNIASAKSLLGQVLYRRADFSGAARIFSEIIQQHPEWDHADRAAYGKAMSQFGMLDYSGAAQTLELLLNEYPESEHADDSVYWLGEAFYRRGNYEGALARFNQFLTSYPSHALSEYATDSVAWCLEQLEKRTEAIKIREHFLRDFPDSALKGSVEMRLASDYLRTGNRRKAIEHNLRAESSNLQPPLGDRALLRAGFLLFESEQFQKAAQTFEKLLAKKVDAQTARPAMAAMGNSYLRTGNYEKAEAVFKELLESAKGEIDHGPIAFQLALAQMALGKYAVAADQFSIIVDGAQDAELKPLAAVALAECLGRLNRPGAAAEKLHSFVDKQPIAARSPEVAFALAASLFKAERFDEAGRILEDLSADEQAVR